ncbi:LuxR C-terminal-related transcriptional regulator [Rhodococcus sp. NPDC056960]|uniref:LuxR C-terminal-related transcriptional regulator n=1 Tax=Rhodococcus sp. NPDC056960 TaxID=3345982 RepID=UPI003637FDB2
MNSPIDSPSEHSVPFRPGTLPAPVTTFIGRTAEIAEIADVMRSARLVTLVGMGGVGKTRLALSVAAEHDDPVWLVNLEHLTDESLLWETVSAALGVSPHPSQGVEAQLSNYLSTRRLLLVLDNCEHILEACATLVSQLLGSAPELKVLATSRTALDVPGEHVVTVAPLAVPLTDGLDAGRKCEPDAIRDVESVQLFLDRARSQNSAFVLDDDNAAAIAQLCAQLEGLPLAIELAANRLRALGVKQVLERLGDRFAILSGTMKSIPPRQRTLKALVDWSYELCTPAQQQLWARLSVFSGTFGLDAAESVCAGTDVSSDDLLTLIDQLVAQSILIASHPGSVVRYRMLETIREYGREQLRSTGTEDTYHRRHSFFYLDLARECVRNWCGPHQAASLARLRVEHQNLRAALQWMLTTPGHGDMGLALASALRFHWVVNGMLSEGRRWLASALAASPSWTATRAEGLWVAAWAATLQGDLETAETLREECLAVTGLIGDYVNEAYAVQLHAAAALFVGQLPEAIELYDTAAEMHERQRNPSGVLLILFQNAIALTYTDQSSRARAVSQRALAISDSYGEQWARSYTRWAMGVEEWLHGSVEVAEQHSLAALAIADVFYDRVCTGVVVDTLACIAVTRRHYVRAAVLLGVAKTVWEPLGTTISALGVHSAEHHRRCERGAREELGEDVFEHYFTAGRDYDPSAAIRWILTGLDLAAVHPQTPTFAPNVLDVLTKREKEVADLLARGMSNREMADHLVVSRRTIEGHMENILSKLGCSSRGQVIALIAASGR